MSWIQIVVLFIANTFLMLKLASAYPITNISTRSTGDNAVTCDATRPYCCDQSLQPPSILDLHEELSSVIDLLSNSCTNTTYKENAPLRSKAFSLDENNEDLQNDFLNGIFQIHMAIEESKKELCKAEEEKFYRGESSMIEKCNLNCAVANAEKQIVLYLQGKRCGCKKNGKIQCRYSAKPKNEGIRCRGDCNSLMMVTCQLWDSFNFIQQIFSEMWYLRLFQ